MYRRLFSHLGKIRIVQKSMTQKIRKLLVDLDQVKSTAGGETSHDLTRHRSGAWTNFQHSQWPLTCEQWTRQSASEKPTAGSDSSRGLEALSKLAIKLEMLRESIHEVRSRAACCAWPMMSVFTSADQSEISS